MEIKDKIRLLLDRADWKQKKLAAKIGETENRVSRWLNGTGKPDAVQAYEIAEAFGVSLYWLCDDRMGPDELTTSSAAHLSSDEREVLKVYRSARSRGINSQRAIDALIDLVQAPPADGEGREISVKVQPASAASSPAPSSRPNPRKSSG